MVLNGCMALLQKGRYIGKMLMGNGVLEVTWKPRYQMEKLYRSSIRAWI